MIFYLVTGETENSFYVQCLSYFHFCEQCIYKLVPLLYCGPQHFSLIYFKMLLKVTSVFCHYLRIFSQFIIHTLTTYFKYKYI